MLVQGVECVGHPIKITIEEIGIGVGGDGD